MKTTINNNNIQIFNNDVFGNVRIIFCQPDEPLFCLKDVCAALALDSKQVIRRLDKGVVSKHPLSTDGGKQTAAFVTEDGLYDVILDSRKAAARAFRKWVTAEVLPQIRRNGRYEMTARLHLLEACVNQLEETNAELRPKAEFTDAVLCSEDTLTVTQMAQDYGVGPVRFNRLLEALRIQHRVGGQWVLFAPHQGRGYVHSYTTYHTSSRDGYIRTQLFTRWTQLGRHFLYERLKREGIEPNTEEGAKRIAKIIKGSPKRPTPDPSREGGEQGAAHTNQKKRSSSAVHDGLTSSQPIDSFSPLPNRGGVGGGALNPQKGGIQ